MCFAPPPTTRRTHPGYGQHTYNGGNNIGNSGGNNNSNSAYHTPANTTYNGSNGSNGGYNGPKPCRNFNAARACSAQPCLHAHICDICGGAHPHKGNHP